MLEFERLLERILDCAKAACSHVCLDVEDVSCTQLEIDLFIRLCNRHDNVGLALQAYLLRTHQDIQPLLAQGSTPRICKGIYLEEPSHLVKDAWRDRAAINPNFVQHMERCFEAGTFIAIATNDALRIGEIVERARQLGVEKTCSEFQMLLGVCEPLRDKLLRMGFNVRIYVPYGADW